MKKRTCSLMIALAIVLALGAFPVQAEDVDPYDPGPIIEEYQHLLTISAGLSISSSGLATCAGAGNSYYVSDTCYLTLRLYRQSSDGTWSVIKTWYASGSPAAAATKSYYVTHGHNYKVVATVSVYTSTGTYIETVSKTSKIVYY